MIRQCLEALDENTQHPRELDPHRAPHAAQGNPLHQQAFDERTPFIRDEVWLEALDELASTVVAVMVLCAAVDVARCLVLGRPTPRTHVSEPHGLPLTSTGGEEGLRPTGAHHRFTSMTWSALPSSQAR
jgi:hypothetical protein